MTDEGPDKNGKRKIVDWGRGTLLRKLNPSTRMQTLPQNPQIGLHLDLISQTQAPD